MLHPLFCLLREPVRQSDFGGLSVDCWIWCRPEVSTPVTKFSFAVETKSLLGCILEMKLPAKQDREKSD